jgi:hypothetical protein
MTSAEELDTSREGATDEDERLNDLRQALIDAAQDVIANLEDDQRRATERQRLLFAVHQLLAVLGESDEPEESPVGPGVAFPPPRPGPWMRPLPPPFRAPMFGPPRPRFGPPPPWSGPPWPSRPMPRRPRPPGVQLTD